MCEIPHKAPRNMLTVTVKLTNVLKLGNGRPRLSGTHECSPWLFIENHLIPGAPFPTPFKHNPKLRTRPLEKGTSPAVGARRAQSLHNAEIWSWWRGAFQAAHAWWPWWFSSRWSCGSQLKWARTEVGEDLQSGPQTGRWNPTCGLYPTSTTGQLKIHWRCLSLH